MSIIEIFQNLTLTEIGTQRLQRVAAYITAVSPLIKDPLNVSSQIAFYDYLANRSTSQTPSEKVSELTKVVSSDEFRQKLGSFIERFTGKLLIMETRLNEAKSIASINDLPEGTRLAILEREYIDLIDIAKGKMEGSNIFNEDLPILEPANIVVAPTPPATLIKESLSPNLAAGGTQVLDREIGVVTPPTIKATSIKEVRVPTQNDLTEVLNPTLPEGEKLVSDSDLGVLESFILNGEKSGEDKGSFRKGSKVAKIFSLIVEKTNRGGIDTKELMGLLNTNLPHSVLGAIANIKERLRIFNSDNSSSVEYKIYSINGKRGVSSRFYITEVQRKKEGKTPQSDVVNKPIQKPLDEASKLISALDILASEEGLENALEEARALFVKETDKAKRARLQAFITESEGLISAGEELEEAEEVKDNNKGKVRGRGMEAIYKPDEIVDYTQVPILAGELPWQFQDFSLLGIHLTNGVKICLDFVDHSKSIVSIIDVLKASKFGSFSQLKSLIQRYSEFENPMQIIQGDKKLERHNIYIHTIPGHNGIRIFYTPIIRRYKRNNVEYVDRIMVIHAIADYNNEGRAYTLLKSAITRARSKHERSMKGKR